MSAANCLSKIQEKWMAATVGDEGRAIGEAELLERARQASIVAYVSELIGCSDFESLQLHTEKSRNGFTRLDLAGEARDWPQVRLHQWDGPNAMDIHEHPWNAVVFVLRGRVTERRIELTPGASHLVLIHWSIDYGLFELFEAGWCSPVERWSRIVREGELYQLTSGEFHTAAAEPGSVTLMLRSAYLREFSRIVRPTGQSETPLSGRSRGQLNG